jgi:hypothetical protein
MISGVLRRTYETSSIVQHFPVALLLQYAGSGEHEGPPLLRVEGLGPRSTLRRESMRECCRCRSKKKYFAETDYDNLIESRITRPLGMRTLVLRSLPR